MTAEMISKNIMLSVIVSVGNDDRDWTLEQFEQDVKETLRDGVGAKNITVTNGYYILDGKVCLAGDYDHETQDRIPGTHAPSWAGGPTDSELAAKKKREEVLVEVPRRKMVLPEVKRVERDPVTGRKVRADKGKARLKPTQEQIDAVKADSEKLADKMVEA